MAADYESAGRRHWADDEITWDMWEIPGAQLGSLPEVEGRDVIELGCGTAYVSSWLARRGARPVGIDPTTGFAGGAIEALHELQAPEGATSRHTYVTPAWARRWPSEESWVARLADGQERSSPVA
ncbi:MAG TPA: hypothetical protein VF087_12175 [Solirubrobacteraceae bacterium]